MSLFHGQLVRLSAPRPDDAEIMARWWRDSEFARLLDADAARPMTISAAKTDLDEEPKPHSYPFLVRTLSDDKLIGFVGLWVNEWNHSDAWVGIGMGERDYWGKGYGTEAMRLALRYAFTELNLYRVSLGVFAYNERAVKSYQKAGFVLEGRMRETLHRDGQRWDEFRMGILRDEWLQHNNF